MNTPPKLRAESYTRTDVEEFRRLMTELVKECRTISEQHADGWQPSSPDLLSEFGESMALIADLSRTLNHTRGGIRRINDGARHRSYSRAAEPASHRQ
ncbi:hypothetical protein [Streptomyces sp. KR55]|uniref:hypothetical protein n=1 Tax=Streptomyces sp. KR55 TaxID=3457425 RepID=UPI003FD15301